MKEKESPNQEKDLWSSEKLRKFNEDFDKAFEPYEKMGFEPMDNSSLLLLGLLAIVLIPVFIGFLCKFIL